MSFQISFRFVQWINDENLVFLSLSFRPSLGICDLVKCPGDSHCFLKQNGLHECRCPSEDECPSTGEKVCGSDGITYDNECKLKAAACRSGGGLVLKKEGSCGKYKEIIQTNTAVSRLYGSFC